VALPQEAIESFERLQLRASMSGLIPIVTVVIATVVAAAVSNPTHAFVGLKSRELHRQTLGGSKGSQSCWFRHMDYNGD